MRRTLQLLAAAVTVAASGSALAAGPQAIPVSPAGTTAGVATLELVDPVALSGRSVPSRNGLHFNLCDRGSRQPCSIARPAAAARRQAFELALATLRSTAADVVVVGLPQSPRVHALLVFERDILDAPALDPLVATADRLYAMGSLVHYSDAEDSLVLFRLRPWPAAQPGR